MKISLNFKKTLNQNISDIYSKIKKFKKKLNSVNVEIEKTKKKIKIQKEENKKVDERKIFNETLKKINKKKWYENFTYTFTENNLLFVIARNATDNEILIKKHLEKNDLVFHTLSPKSPFGILKEGKKKANETDLNNCAKFISCFFKYVEK